MAELAHHYGIDLGGLYFGTRNRTIVTVVLHIIVLVILFFVFNYLEHGSLIIPFWYAKKFNQKKVNHDRFIGAMRPNMFESEQANINREDNYRSMNAKLSSHEFKPNMRF